MKKLLLTFFFINITWACLAQNIKYVKPNGAGTKDGSSWANASDDLQDMINKSTGNFQDPSQNQIWVAAGTYKPNRKADALTTITPNNRDNAFVLKADVKIYGGFPTTGNPTMFNRNWNTNVTILSGDLGAANNTDNAYHVVIGAFNNGGQELNGFVITGGNANGTGNITVNTRTINQKRGGGVYAENTSFLLTNVKITGNITSEYGGGMYNVFSSPILANVSINGNSAATGGGLYNNSGSMSLTNVTVTGNTATSSASELFQAIGSSVVNLRNSIVFGTTVLNSANISYSLVSGITNTTNDNVNTTGLTGQQIFTDASNNDFTLKQGSPAVNAGNNAYNTSTTDLAGNTRTQKDRIDMGAYESIYSTPPVPDINGILYVKKDGAGNKTGSSWQHAIGELANALVAAKANPAIKEIWVASGTYQPMYAPTNGTNFTDQTRDNAFLLVNNVKVYGGFPASGTPTMANRDWKANPTLLSGDLGVANDNTDNVYHVIVITGLDEVTLDGFTVQDGYANGNTSFQYPGNSISRGNGGGIWISNNTNVVISNCLIKNNVALSNGGGLYNDSPITLISCIFTANKALLNGGGMYNSYADPMITNCSFTGNAATFFGGGTRGGAMYNDGSSPTITNCTFAGNTASGGVCGGIYNKNGSVAHISNSIFWDNQSPQVQDDGSTSAITYTIVQGGFTGTGNLNADPLFVDVTTSNYNLQATSPAVNAGNNAAIPVGITTDLVGQVRVQRNRVDLGAYESAYNTAPSIVPGNGIIYVKKGATGDGSSWLNATAELADALKFVKTNNAITTNPQVSQIWVAKGTYKPLYRADNFSGADATDRNNAFLLVDKVKIYGGFPDTGNPGLANRNPTSNLATLSGNLGATSAFHVVVSVGATNETILDGFTITEGNANGTGINSITIDTKQLYQANGAGVYNLNSSPTLSNCTIAINNTTGRGAGMYNDNSSPLLNDCIFKSNICTGLTFGGGAMYNVSGSAPVLKNNNFENNKGSFGGAICNLGAAPKVINSIFKNNRAEGANGSSGGAIYNNNTSSGSFDNCVFYGNYASSGGGAFYNNQSSPEITNATFYGNTLGGGVGNALNGQAVKIEGTGTFTLNNSILWVNDSFIADGVLYGSVSGQNNFIEQIGGPPSNPVSAYTAAQLFNNPTAGDLTLKANSPAIDAGNNAVVTETKDLLGNTRIRNNTVDIGAYEVQNGNTPGQTQTINPIANITKTYGDTAFEPGATATSGLIVSYTSADNTIAEAYQDVADANKWKLRIKKAGTINITAHQPGGAGYDPAPDKIFSLTISPKVLTITATGNNKIYDGNANATVSLSNNALAGDIVNATYTAAVFDNKNVGNGKSINVSGIAVSGTDAGNYTFNTTATTTGNITPFALTISATGNNKIYDGNANATVSLSNNAFVGDAISTSYNTAVFDNKNVGNGKTINVSGIAVSGTDAGNYTFNTIATTTGNITPFALTITATGNNKVYDAATNATVSLSHNALAGDVVNATYTAAVFDSKNVGNGKVVTITGITLTGADAGNYTFNITATTTGNITPFALTISATGNNKVYDGNTNATVSLSNNAFVGDVINTAYATAVFDNKNVDNGKDIAITGITLTGADAGNYTFNITATTTGNITPFALTISATGNNKVYNGNINATVSLSHNAFAGDVVNAAYATVVFDNKNVGNGKDITITGTTLTGADAGNYTFNTGAHATANITPFALSVTATGNNKIYDGNTNATVSLSHNAFAGDIVNAAYATAVFDNKNVGNGKDITITGITLTGADAGNYTFNTGTHTTANITPFALSVTATGNNKVYDGNTNATVSLSHNAIVGDVVNTAYATAVFDNKNIGNGKVVTITGITLTGAAIGNYTFNNTASTTANISAKLIAVSAVAKNKVFGEADPVLTYNYSPELITGDVFTGALTRALGEDIGNYPIGQGTLTAGLNYTLTYEAANLTIDPKVVTITAEAKSKTYGEVDPVLTYSVNGLSTGDIVSGSLNRQAGENVGSYAITKGTLSVGNNYTLNYLGANLNISKKNIAVIANANSKIYGDADPDLTYTFSPHLIVGDRFTGALSRAVGEHAGNYPIQQGTLSAGANYAISYQGAVLAIQKAVLAVAAKPAQICQGGSLPAFGLIYSGFKAGDNESSLANQPTVSTTATSSSPAGNYVLSPSGGSALNYTFSYTNSTLTINALPTITITSNKGNSISKGEVLTLTANGGNNYSWKGEGIISGQYNAMLTLRPLISGNYTVTVTNASGCSEQQTFSVTVREDFQNLTATNLLSPNGDGVNDFWKVDNIDVYPDNEVKIFDRAGRVLYTKRSYDNTWDGTVNGTALAEGTYYYVIDFGNGKPKQKGFITLLRESRR